MNIHDNAIAKLRSLPESLVTEINDYIDYLVWKHGSKDSNAWLQSTESLEMVNSDFRNYLSNLEDYENRLVRGEIKW